MFLVSKFNNKNQKGNGTELKNLIPLYLNDLLENSQKIKIEKYLQEDESLRKELKEWDLIKKAYQLIAEETPEPSKEAFSKILKRLKKNRIQEIYEKLLFILTPLKSPKFSFALILLQFILILILLSHIWFSQKTYYTLSTPALIDKNLVKINIIFKETAREKEIRELLLSNQAKIIDGPYPSGVYIIGIEKDKMNKVLDAFKKSNIVEFTEKAY